MSPHSSVSQLLMQAVHLTQLSALSNLTALCQHCSGKLFVCLSLVFKQWLTALSKAMLDVSCVSQNYAWMFPKLNQKPHDTNCQIYHPLHAVMYLWFLHYLTSLQQMFTVWQFLCVLLCTYHSRCEWGWKWWWRVNVADTAPSHVSFVSSSLIEVAHLSQIPRSSHNDDSGFEGTYFTGYSAFSY
jgi:hypothetical protein